VSRPPVTWKATFWVVVTLALGLRLFQLGQNSLWIDEIASLRTIAGSFWEVAEAAMRHNAFEPPLYFWLLDIAAQLFGMSEVGVRLVSAIAGALTIPVVWLLVREMTRREDVAALCATLLALNPLHIWYSQEARPYALMVLFGSAALLCFARAARSGSTRDWAGFAIATALALLSHVFGGTALLTAWAWALLRGNRAALRPLLGASLAVVILIAPFYVPLFHATVIATNVGAHPRALTGLEIPYTVYTYLGGYSFGPSQREIQDLGFQAALTQNLGQVAVAVILLTIALALAAARRTAASLDSLRAADRSRLRGVRGHDEALQPAVHPPRPRRSSGAAERRDHGAARAKANDLDRLVRRRVALVGRTVVLDTALLEGGLARRGLMAYRYTASGRASRGRASLHGAGAGALRTSARFRSLRRRCGSG